MSSAPSTRAIPAREDARQANHHEPDSAHSRLRCVGAKAAEFRKMMKIRPWAAMGATRSSLRKDFPDYPQSRQSQLEQRPRKWSSSRGLEQGPQLRRAQGPGGQIGSAAVLVSEASLDLSTQRNGGTAPASCACSDTDPGFWPDKTTSPPLRSAAKEGRSEWHSFAPRMGCAPKEPGVERQPNTPDFFV